MSEPKKTTVKKMSQGYGYRYTELSAIHDELEKQGITYWQETSWDERAGADYILTHLIIDGEELPARRGVKVISTVESKMNAAQAQGSGLTYARRYSLLMALGWSTEDDDAASAGSQGRSKQSAKRPWDKYKKTSDSPTDKQLSLVKTLLARGGASEEDVSRYLEGMRRKTSKEVSMAIEKLEARIAEKQSAENLPNDDELENVEGVIDGVEIQADF